MRVKTVKNNKKGNPKELTVVMSVDEAGVIAKTFGGFSYSTFQDKFPDQDISLHSEIYDCLTGDFFNKYWDAGVDGWMTGDKPGEWVM